MTPLKPVSRKGKAALGLGFFVLFVTAWSVATFGGFVSKTFLADPLTMVKEGYALFAQHGFAFDVAITIWRVVGGFVLAAVFAVPLGIALRKVYRDEDLLRLERDTVAATRAIDVGPRNGGDPIEIPRSATKPRYRSRAFW